jgi:hypothetical protein
MRYHQARIERRFDRVNRVPVTIEWLSDNGSCYIAGNTRSFARDIGRGLHGGQGFLRSSFIPFGVAANTGELAQHREGSHEFTDRHAGEPIKRAPGGTSDMWPLCAPSIAPDPTLT